MLNRTAFFLGCFLSSLSFAAQPLSLHKRSVVHATVSAIPQTSQDSIHVGTLTLHHCPDAPAYCGMVERALDPTGAVDGAIEVHFEFYPHTDHSQQPLETIVAAEGGPGFATTGSRAQYLGLFAPLFDRRDLLLVDERGTGKSQAVNCPLLQSEPNPRFPGIKACSAQLGDTRYLYGSGLAADDMAAILDALAIPVVNLYGDSYGTYFAQTFAGRHPDRLRSVILDSAYPVRGLSPWYPEIAITARFAFDAVCRRSPSCSSLPGKSLGRIQQLLDSLRANPVTGWAHDGNGTLRRTRADATSLAYLMVSNLTQSVVYRELDPAARAYLEQGDSAPLLRLLAENQVAAGSGGAGNPYNSYSQAMFVGVSCQDYPQIYDMNLAQPERHLQRDQALADKQKNDPNVYAPFTVPEFDRVTLDTSVLDLCLDWEAPAVTPPYPPGQPVPPQAHFTSAPVLVLSGDLDSLTPALQGAEAARLFQNGRQIIVESSFHVTAAGDQDNCASEIAVRFVRNLDPGDATCAKHIAEVHLVPRFAATAQELDPAVAIKGNQGTDADLRIAAATAYTLGDVLARWWVNSTGDGVGFRGGRFHFSGATNLSFFQLNKMQFVEDVQVSGKMQWDFNYPGGVLAHVHVDGGANETGELFFSWNSHAPLAQATITGHLGSRRISATMYAP